ncbi:MAG: TonB-dependent receptor plug domain-containing protein [Bacteroidetes bacterium]|jgi:hypothetical protein|nr:TonB-dependent receptor plug domain-containing protein [Bacteroidota bacterium]MBT6686061.1 TonB-dependent receptor plug domain-containing protein [Bacteroidota bacterium]MBT7144305.1 TonB-dependent receptor plug domain-containing protein [Bacteroidota bacterium]MBT7490382.1 TonB-dependent receptor plug domain-containing protein [Bacteroidota bacterium]
MRIRIGFIFFVFFIGLSKFVLSQEDATIYGKIADKKNRPIELVNISVEGYPIGIVSDNRGKYELKVPANTKLIIHFSHIEYENVNKEIFLETGERQKINVSLKYIVQNIPEISVRAKREKNPYLVRIDPKLVSKIPDASGGIEAILKTYPGVSSNNELSSQYSVRGGNYDENLVYVNNIEVYRPLLIRSGQQEGLSFVNSDMVSSIHFSSGGFDAKYGDKMSSVLDIRYKKPSEFGSTITGSLLGGSIHLEDCSKNHRFTHISGIRYKSSQYVLNSLETEGDYKPSFSDFQTYLTFDLNEKFELSFLGNYARNTYYFVPETRNTSFGTINEALKLKIYFDGQELDEFTTYTGAFSGNYMPNDKLKLSLTTSLYQTNEQETFDIQGQYWINQLDNDLGSDALGDSLMNIGVGTFLNHARNYLQATVMNFNHHGFLVNGNHNIQWGAKIQHEKVNDKISEWEMLDSAGYSLPYSDSAVNLQQSLHVSNTINSNRFTFFLQETYSVETEKSNIFFTGGIRGNYWDFNKEFLFSPRFSFAIKPNWKKDIEFRLAVGVYYQSPFYKELKNSEGEINRDLKAQRSIHLVFGSEYNFRMMNRPFKYVGEIYYKKLDNLIPYTVDNVRIRYLAKNNASGFAGGVDMKLNGEFVKGIDSWVSLSIMQTKEDLNDDSYIETDSLGIESTVYPGYIPRPTNQLINFGLFFQDYLPMNPSFKMQLYFMYGTGLPFGPPDSERYEATLKMPSYFRVDIGFSKEIIGENSSFSSNNPFRFVKSMWLSAHVYNLIDRSNTISYVWIKDVRNQEYAIPNYLTSRRINIKLNIKF